MVDKYLMEKYNMDVGESYGNVGTKILSNLGWEAKVGGIHVLPTYL